MGTREKDARLSKIWEDGGRTFSISKLNTLTECSYQAYLKYVKQLKANTLNVYSNLGSIIHDTIEATIKGEANESDLSDAIQKELDNLEMLGIDFPLDRNGEQTIRRNWIANMERFVKEYKTFQGDFETERLIILPIDEKNYMIGYLDAMQKFDDGSVWLIDWKSGHNYSAKEEVEAGRQLVFYKMALEKEGYKVSRASWVLLKYCKTSWTLKNGKKREKVSEWRNLISDLRNPIEKALHDAGYDEMDIDIMLSNGEETNSWSAFPEEIRNKFKTELYIRDYEITKDKEEEAMRYIRNGIAEYTNRSKKDPSQWPAKDLKKDSFFCSSLCDYGGCVENSQCKYWIDFVNQSKANGTNDDDLF